MEIRMHFALLVGVCFGVAQAAEQPIHIEIADLSHQICEGLTDGHLVPHPLDCNAYFACGSLATLQYCEEGLHFDAAELVCDVPEKAKCTAMEGIYAVTTTAPGGNLDPAIGAKPYVDYNWWMGKPQPVFVAVDVETGQAVNPMEKYDPEHVECRHFGAYFLPHPSNCQLYFICAYGHLHRHQCGRGTLWNYRSSECQLRTNAECYNYSQEPLVDEPKEPSTTSGQVTICYIVNTSSALPSLSSDRESTTSASAPTPPSAPPSAPHSALKCPSERQSYLPHPDDCGKYYICIAGMPVLTTCPKGLYWDQKAGYCDQAKNVKCFQNQ
ncbi:uncharacterized protein Dvir_GJ13757 [Drosophila virilis]|uniref:Chitin-binding type-2 domain-containing protein n=1 Tax=Drosophila virilis TaxID=7244 RepID=B4LG11_DROVI|nr:uncharacterized protein Dvir_GJ13757 [Drosophila virilis]